jgi:hypothetical protein
MSLVATGRNGGPRRLRKAEYRAQYITQAAGMCRAAHTAVSTARVQISEIRLWANEASTNVSEAKVDDGESWMQ